MKKGNKILKLENLKYFSSEVKISTEGTRKEKGLY